MKAKTYIIGVVDCYGAVMSETSDTCRSHANLYPEMYQLRWRWCEEWGIRETDQSTIDDKEILQRVKDHLYKRYGIE